MLLPILSSSLRWRRFQGRDDSLHVNTLISRCGDISDSENMGKGIPYLIEDILQLVLRQRRALHILDRSQVFRHTFSVLFTYWLHALFGQLFPYLRVIAKIGLRTHYEARYSWAVVMNFWEPFLSNVLERRWGCDAEADQKYVGLGV